MEENSTSPPPESRERSCFPFAFCTVPFAICTVPFAISTVLDRADGARRDLKKKFNPPPWPPHGRLKKKSDRSKCERDRTNANGTVQKANGTVQIANGTVQNANGKQLLSRLSGGGSDRIFPHNSLLGGVKSII